MRLDAVEALARDLMAEHLPEGHGFAFAFDNARRRAGACHWRYAVPGDRSTIVPDKITLSRKIMVLWEEEHVRATILHEIAHALAGHEENHGPRFRILARRIGTSGDRCYSAELPSLERRWIGRCPNGCEQKRDVRPRGGRRSCGPCGSGRFDPDLEIVWTRNPAADRPVERPAAVAASTAPPVRSATPVEALDPRKTLPSWRVQDTLF